MLDVVVTTLVGRGDAPSEHVDGPVDVARFRECHGLAADAEYRTLVVSDGHLLRIVTVPEGTVRTLAGCIADSMRGAFADDDSSGERARFFAPHGIAYDYDDRSAVNGDGRWVVADQVRVAFEPLASRATPFAHVRASF